MDGEERLELEVLVAIDEAREDRAALLELVRVDLGVYAAAAANGDHQRSDEQLRVAITLAKFALQISTHNFTLIARKLVFFFL